MSIKTYINGQENGVIVYKGDTEPCAVYVNGERQDNISYIPQEAEGVNSVQYNSEYKNNLRSLQIEGNTVQENVGSISANDATILNNLNIGASVIESWAGSKVLYVSIQGGKKYDVSIAK